MRVWQRRALHMPYAPANGCGHLFAPHTLTVKEASGAGTQTLKQWGLIRRVRIPIKCPRDPAPIRGGYPVTSCFYVFGRGFTWGFS
jgi:hypothetical protein